MRHTISILVENEFGVLARVAGLFSGRAFNIESLSVAETMDPSVSRITLVTRGDDQVLEQVEKQLNKLIDVIRVIDFTDTPHVERELVLIKVAVDERTRGEVANIMAATVGGRNTALHTAAVKLGTLVGAGLLTEYEAERVLLEAARASGYISTDGERQARKTVTSGLRWGIAHPREVSR